MKKTITTLTLTLLTLLSTSAFIAKYSNGIAGFTASPGEASCNNPGCHSGGSSAVSGITITSVPSFSANEFMSDTTYRITINVSASGFSRYGFGCEILDASSVNAGTMLNQGAGVKFLFSGSRKNAVHTVAKTGTSGASFSFDWVAPESDTATFFVAANAVNGNGTTTGDFPITPIMMQLKQHVDIDTSTTGIAENKASLVNNLSVYPNPASGLTSISYFLVKSQQVSVQLVDMNGKVVREFMRATETPGPQSHLLDLHNIVPGVYFVKTALNDQKVSQKLIAVQ